MNRCLVSTDTERFKGINDLKIRIKKKMKKTVGFVFFFSFQWIISEVNGTVLEQVFTNMLY